jgi:regulatory protein
MVITSITPQKRNKLFYNIHIDYEYFCSLDDETIYHMKLKEGMDVDAELLMEASKKSSYKKALNYTLNILSKSSKTKQELIKKMTEKEYNEDTIAAVIAKVNDLGYINDIQYIEDFIRNKADTSQGLNKRTLQNKMIQKGLDKELIQQSLENSNIDEYQNAVQVAEKKLRNLKGNEREKKSKLYAYLINKGFDYEVCSNVINNVDITE